MSAEEREDTDLGYTLSWLPRTGRPEEPAFGYARVEERYAGDLRQVRSEVSLQVSSAAWTAADSAGWLAGAGLRHTTGHASSAAREVLRRGSEEDIRRSEQAAVRVADTDVLGYGERRWAWRPGLVLAAALRGARFGHTSETLVMPRLSATWTPSPVWRGDVALGAQAQPPLFREELGRARAGAAEPLRSQKALVATAGVQRQSAGGYWRAEAYGRLLRDAVSYTADELQLRYSGANDTHAYAYGAHLQVRGQILRAVGTMAYSYLVTREDVEGDGLGYQPRPTDQRHTLSAFLEDRMEVRFGWLRASRFHLRLLYGSGFLFTPMVRPEGAGAEGLALVPGDPNSRRGHPYFRFDTGLTQAFEVRGVSLEVREEVANLFDQYNVVGYSYLPAPDGTVGELRRSLGRRHYTLEVRAEL